MLLIPTIPAAWGCCWAEIPLDASYCSLEAETQVDMVVEKASGNLAFFLQGIELQIV